MYHWICAALLAASMPICAQSNTEHTEKFLTCFPIGIHIVATTYEEEASTIKNRLVRMASAALREAEIPTGSQAGGRLFGVFVGQEDGGYYKIGLMFQKPLYDFVTDTMRYPAIWEDNREGLGGRQARLDDFAEMLDSFVDQFLDANKPEVCAKLRVQANHRYEAFYRLFDDMDETGTP